MTAGKTSFSTAIGVCAVEWTEYGIARFRLPDISAGVGLQVQTGDILALDDVPAEVMIVIDAVRDLVSGKNIDLSTTRLDMRKVSAFNKRVYAEALKIPRGKTITYGILAAAIGDKGAAQAVGRALGDNPIPLIIPCHRIVAANGAMHGFSAPGGVASKRRLLEIEGAIEPEPPTLFDFADM